MKRFSKTVVGLLIGALLFAGCKVDGEKIELWKSTQKGPKKIAGVLIDPAMDMGLRAQSAVALTEIKEHTLLTEAFRRIEAKDGDAVIAAVAPLLAEIAQGEPGKEDSLDPAQVAAKDGLYLLYEFTGEKSQGLVQDALVAWCTEGNFNSRSRAGFAIQVIVKKVGAPALLALARTLTLDHPYLKPIADLVRQSDDSAALAEASTRIAVGMDKAKSISKIQFLSAAAIGGQPVSDALLTVATNKDRDENDKRLALRAYSLGLEEGHITGSPAQVTLLLAIAQDPAQDKFHREETYMTMAQIPDPSSEAAFKTLLEDADFFWRMVGTRCLLRLDGEAHMEATLSARNLARDEQEIKELIDLVALFPKQKETMLAVATGKNAFARGVVLGALAKVATKEDIPALKELSADKQSLPRGFESRTAGSAAAAAIEAIEKG